MNQQHAIPRNGVPIRLSSERWQHIIEEHAELTGLREQVLQAITEAERVFSGAGGELLAMHLMEPGKAIVAVYRDIDSNDGFIITAFVTRRLESFERREQVWPPPA